jgi:uncharacterized protein (DUF1778 family)
MLVTLASLIHPKEITMPSKKPAVLLRIDAEVLSKAKIAARAQDRTLTSYVAWLVRSAVQDAENVLKTQEKAAPKPTKESWTDFMNRTQPLVPDLEERKNKEFDRLVAGGLSHQEANERVKVKYG